MFVQKLIPYVYKIFMTVLMCTCRIKVHGKERTKSVRESGKGLLYSLWHDNNLIAVWALRSEKFTAMVSNSKDGEIISRVIELTGNSVIRGSTSKGAMQAAQQGLRILSKNKVLAITPDGPRGPKYHLQEGVLYLSALTKSPVIPVHLEASRQWEFNSWDTSKLPKPFSTLYVVYGEPVSVTSEDMADEDSKEKARQRVQQAMMKNVEAAKRYAGRVIDQDGNN